MYECAVSQAMPLLGCHVSIAGGMNLAVDRGRDLGCDAIQVFTKNQNQWKAKPLDPDDVKEFRRKAKGGPWPAMSHASYLINCASPKDDLWAKSVEGLTEEYARCEALGIAFLVFHPGAHTGSGADAGIRRISAAVSRVLEAHPKGTTVICLENMAGAATVLGSTWEELARMRDGVSADRKRVGVCLDTCHAFAAGVDMTDAAKYGEQLDAFDERLGLGLLKCIQLNDSKFELGAKKDRHENIGKGHIGLEHFRLLVNDKRFAKHAMVLETDPRDDAFSGWKKDLKALRGLVGRDQPFPTKRRKGQQHIG